MQNNGVEKVIINESIHKNTYVTIFMVNGFQLHGHILNQDDVSILIEADGKKRLLYKCNISTIDF